MFRTINQEDSMMNLIQRSYSVGKRVNGGAVYHLGTYATHEEAETVRQDNAIFHLARCPQDTVLYIIIPN